MSIITFPPNATVLSINSPLQRLRAFEQRQRLRLEEEADAARSFQSDAHQRIHPGLSTRLASAVPEPDPTDTPPDLPTYESADLNSTPTLADLIDAHRKAYLVSVTLHDHRSLLQDTFDPGHQLQDPDEIGYAIAVTYGPRSAEVTETFSDLEAACVTAGQAEGDAWRRVAQAKPIESEEVKTWVQYMKAHAAMEPLDELVRLRKALSHLGAVMMEWLAGGSTDAAPVH